MLPKALDFTVDGTDLPHIFRAIMGLYLGMIVLWVLGALRESLTSTALIANVVFMFGLAFGRVLSIVVDGVPSVLLVYTALEVAVGLWGVLVLKKLTAASQAG
ncbi:MAG: DUF4345 domain-containing protein [bacterium]|nr:DUF4345 domain-containing protein [bacterium]